MALTGQELCVGFSRFIHDYWASTASTSSLTSNIVDTQLQRGADEYYRDYYARITETSHAAIWQVRRVSAFTNSTGTATVAPVFGTLLASGEAYELHRFDPADKFTALDEARIRVYPDLGQLIFNDTLTGDGVTKSFDIPSAVRRGPLFVLGENPAPLNTGWNFLQNPQGDSATGWTSASATRTTVTQNDYDLNVPKYPESATKVAVATATNGTLTQVVADMTNSITAALASGRHMTFAAWVYCRTASRVSLKILDDSGTLVTSTAHAGAGWELLTAEANVTTTNATTLSARFDVTDAAGAVDFWWNRAWFYFGTPERVQDVYSRDMKKNMRQDDTTQKIYFNDAPQRGIQLRLIGRDTLSALGTTAATQVTNTMEVDDEAAQVLYSEAARVLFGREQFTTVDFPDLAPRIARADALRRELRTKWRQVGPPGRGVVGPWSS